MSAEAVWAGWLALFLIYEVTAAVMERGKPDRLTLSRNVWQWFDRPGEKVVLGVFLAVLSAHLVLGWPGGLAVILSGTPVAVVIAWELVKRDKRALLVAFCLPLLLGADKCSVSWPQPNPSPTPTTEPTPEPTPVPTPEPTPVPTPVPTPTPEPTLTPPPTSCTVRLDGTREMGVYWYSPWKKCEPGPRCIADATPRIVNAERCNEVGYPGRIKCPVAPDDHPQRGICETALMGGPNPVWDLQGDGTLSLTVDPWKAWVTGTGKGRLRACYPNGQACSEWLEVVR